MSPRGIRDFLGKTEGTTFIQARIEISLAEQVKEILARENISWAKFFRACCVRFIAETEKSRVREKKSKVNRT
jgi:enoyl reductase-like protein